MKDFGRFQTANPKLIQCIETALATAAMPGVLLIGGAIGSGRRLLAEIVIDRVGSERLKRWSPSHASFFAGDVILIENIEKLSLENQQKISQQIEETRSTLKWTITVEQKQIPDLDSKLNRSITGFQLNIPSLKDRLEDFAYLTTQLLSIFSMISNKPTPKISESTLEFLKRQDWPGNVAELEKVLERAFHVCGSELLPHHVTMESKNSFHPVSAAAHKASLAEMEKKLILQTLEVTRHNKTRAAEMLGISIRTLRNKLQIYREEGVQL